MWFHPATAARLAAQLEIPVSLLADALGDDIRQTWVGNNHAMEGIVHEHDGESHTDAWGIGWVKQGPFNQVRTSPLAGADDSAIAAYRFPYGETERLLSNMLTVINSGNGRFIGCDISPCLLELLFRIRGMEETLMDIASEPGRARFLLGEARAFAVHLATEACDRFPLDWLWTGDDVGGQRSMMVSPGCWRDMIRPHLAAIVEVGKSRGLTVAYHSCGAIRPIIPDLIEIGLDVLNPIQCNCPGMDPLELKREFGRSLTFMGGVDTQELLPGGTAEEVYRTTRRLVEGMTSDGGGFILAASHSVPPETPLANIFAMYAAAGESREAIMDRAAHLRSAARGARERGNLPEHAP
jgi:uroporphyrinogen decarboxylase